ncbi:uncharacterized protein LOC113313265 isoform X1 [Papaver somniferum]|uniref:uncharacterized protein LOC113313265 isoform X1 n=1 Tax=Papaver somniferum TaxID=3469 RepID=UPI000E6F57B9|nr:uncharacterized protein LOC113313265 isoform X1 [Papaver somniferum]
MSTGEVRRVSRQDIQLVQNLIERCLQLYMNQKEVVETLLIQAKIEPGFTELVWQKLEEENREFFKAYHVRLMVKHQIMIFNELLEKQVELMRKTCPVGIGMSNGSSLNQNPPCFMSDQRVQPSRPESMHHSVSPSTTIRNGVHGNIQSSDDSSAHTGRMDVSQNMLPTHDALGMIQGVNGIVVKSESGYSNNSPFAFGLDGTVLDTRPTVVDASVASYSSVESNSQALSSSLLDTDASSFGFLGQIPRNFSLSDLTADFSQSSDILESYSRSPFLAGDTDDFLDSPGREPQGDNKRLDTISEGLSFDEFGSE